MYFCPGFSLLKVTSSRFTNVWWYKLGGFASFMRLNGTPLFFVCPSISRILWVRLTPSWLLWVVLKWTWENTSLAFTLFSERESPVSQRDLQLSLQSGKFWTSSFYLLSSGVPGVWSTPCFMQCWGWNSGICVSQTSTLLATPPVSSSSYWFLSFGCRASGRITGSHGSSVLSLRTDLHSVFCNGCANVHSRPCGCHLSLEKSL